MRGKIVRGLVLTGLLVAVNTGCRFGSGTVRDNGSTLRFRNVAREAGIDYQYSSNGKSPLNIFETGGFGGGFIDFNGDGRLDVLITAYDGCHLYVADAKHCFTKVKGGAGLPQSGKWTGLAVGDFDNDGAQDVFIAGFHSQRLFRNASGRFVDITTQAGLDDSDHWNTSATFADVDNDGYLDLFVCRYVEFGANSREFCLNGKVRTACAPRTYPSETSVLYRSIGGKRFVPVTPEVFSKSAGKSWAVIPIDCDDDGWTDLYVANDEEPADFWRNRGGNRFENIAFQNGTALSPSGLPYGGMGIAAADYDGDGRQDLFLASFTEQHKSLFRNVSNEQFQDVSVEKGLISLRPWVSWGSVLDDFDHDGWPDLFLTNGHVFNNFIEIDPSAPGSPYRQPNKLFRNDSGLRFVEVGPEAGPVTTESVVGRGVAAGDFDNDGRIDLLLTDLEGPAQLLHNESATDGRHWIGISLRGRKSNRMGLGCKVTVNAGARRYIGEVRTGGSVFSARDSRLVFGLHENSTVDSIAVRWADGRLSTVNNPKVDQYIEIAE